MRKTSVNELVEGIINDIFTYFRAGSINSNILLKKLINPEIEMINDFDKLLRIHFILQDEVIEFIEELNKNIRKIKKRMETNLILKRGLIKGRINWERTIVLRYTKYFQDKSVFICNDSRPHFNIIENLILKELLSIIYSIFKKDLKEYKVENYKYDWFNKWQKKKKLITHFFEFYQNNIYLKKIYTKKNQKISLKMIKKVLHSRNILYRSAANLLLKYYQIEHKKYDKNFISKLLYSSLIVPKESSTLYELYCIFKIISVLQKKLAIKLNLITISSKELAIFEDKSWIINIFHDSTGNLNFYEKFEVLDKKYKIKYPFMKKLIDSRKNYYRILGKIMKTKPKSYLYSGRPDIIIECWRKYSNNKIKLSILYIGEIKYSLSKYYFSKGLSQLITYIYFAKYKSEYLLDLNGTNQNISKDLKIRGFLISDNTDFLKSHKSNIDDIEIGIYNSKTINNFIFNLD